MADRILVASKVGRPTSVSVYTIDADLSGDALKRIAEALTNPTIETYAINALPRIKYSRLYEIGFLPGVTDNVGHTATEQFGVPIYYSRIYFEPTEYNPLIERCIISKKLASLVVPKVQLGKKTSVITVSLDVPDEELKKIGAEGVLDPSGARRGPLALDLTSMQVIQKHFKKLRRDPTDIELESLAQTWSEHCKHTIFASPIDGITDGIYKTFIKGATNKIRKQKGTKDFCISVFSDNSGGIVFDKDWMISHKVET
ncbi:MAG: hypothetical protein Q8O19_01695, partial [Rectinemataceae bacterium]|nr:hypothetical protein [Rectinemataceae bacterium]